MADPRDACRNRSILVGKRRVGTKKITRAYALAACWSERLSQNGRSCACPRWRNALITEVVHVVLELGPVQAGKVAVGQRARQLQAQHLGPRRRVERPQLEAPAHGRCQRGGVHRRAECRRTAASAQRSVAYLRAHRVQARRCRLKNASVRSHANLAAAAS
jgi:hypothetical protein